MQAYRTSKTDFLSSIFIFYYNCPFKKESAGVFILFHEYSGVPNKHAARLLILGIFSVQHTLIRSNTFIIFWKNFLPTRLFRATRLLKFWNEKHWTSRNINDN